MIKKNSKSPGLSQIACCFILGFLFLITLLLPACRNPSDSELCTIKFITNGGLPVPDDQQVKAGSRLRPPKNPARSGFDLKGWYKDEACKEEWLFESDMVNEDGFLYAKWEARAGAGLNGGAFAGTSPSSTSAYVITMDIYGFGTAAANPSSANPGASITLNAAADPGYEFVGWMVISGGVTLSSLTTSPATFTMPADDVTIRAVFAPEPPPGTKNITLVISDPAIVLTPLRTSSYTECEKSFFVSIPQLTGAETATVNLASPPSDLTLTGSTSIGTAGAFLTLKYTSSLVPFPTTPFTITLAVSPGPFLLTGNPELSVTVFDGLTPASAIPLYKSNFAPFDEYANTSDGLGKHYKLTENIEASNLPYVDPYNNWAPIAPNSAGFSGSFDGQGHTITGLKITTSSDYQGLFGRINNTVKNLGLINVELVKSAASTVINGFGSFAGHNYGTIENCYASGSIVLYGPCGSNIGGIAGQNRGTLQNCYSSVVIKRDAFDATAASVGGIVGYNWNIVEYCYTLGSIEIISDNGKHALGGIVGENVDDNVVGSSAEVKNSVALNPSLILESTSPTIYFGRVMGYLRLPSILRNNFAGSGMTKTLNSSPASISSGVNSIDGETVSPGPGGYNDITWWNSPGPTGPGWAINGTKASSNESSPWWWDGNLPRLWFE